MNKKILLIVGVLLLAAVGGAGYLSMKKSPSQTLANPSPSPVAPQNNESKAETISGTLKSFLTGGKSLKCTFSNKVETTSVEGTIYAAGGKMRGDFKTTTDKTAIGGHMIVDSKFSYIWNDTNNQGFKVPISDTEKVTSESEVQSNAPDINEKYNYSCQNWNKDETLFKVPSNVTFQSFTIPQVTGSKEGTPSSQCSVCDSIPAGDARDACRTQLNCK